MADYRRHIGLVLQEPFLFFGTIAENIAYGKPGATRGGDRRRGARRHAHEFILRLPHGYDSMVGERGQGLSGGERQRISIARALLIDPRILILDEATSSVDTETEKEIQKALDNLVQGRTTIAIAHRLSTLRRADRLVVMDRGRVVEVGTHDELLARQGAYWRSTRRRRARTAEDERRRRRPARRRWHGRRRRWMNPEPRSSRPPGAAEADGTAHAGVVPVRAFPLTDPDGAISLVGSDGRERLWIADPAGAARDGPRAARRRRAGPPRVRAGDRAAARRVDLRRPAPGACVPTAATRSWCSRARKTSAASPARRC